MKYRRRDTQRVEKKATERERETADFLSTKDLRSTWRDFIPLMFINRENEISFNSAEWFRNSH